MIIICGVPSDPQIAMVAGALDNLNADYLILDQRRCTELPLDLEIRDGRLYGQFVVDGAVADCGRVAGVYTRMLDIHAVLGVDLVDDHALMADVRRWHETAAAWFDILPGRVMNRRAAVASNRSKPYQSQLIGQAGFQVPETLVTNDPELVREFRAAHGQVIYKSISSVRSIVQMLDAEALDRLALIRWCPVQFQRYLAGTNVRVHVVAGQVFATRIDTDRVDYRYAVIQGGSANLTPWALPDDLAQRCVALAALLGLELAGIDLLLSEGDTYCFEVNPNPAFSYYESHTRQPIARAIARALGTRS